MRGFILTILLTISFGVFSGDKYPQQSSGEHEFIKIPHSDNFRFINKPARPFISLKPSEIKTCELRARMGASALVRAQDGMTRVEQLEVYDELTSEKDFGLTTYELQKIREILIMTNSVHERHSEITPNEYGDILYDVCVKELEDSPKIET